MDDDDEFFVVVCDMELKQEVDTYVENKPSVWDLIQYNLNVELPAYLINLLTLVGFDNALSLKLMTPADISDVEKMVQTTISDLVDKDSLGDYVGIYKNHPEKFSILPGHRKLLDTIIRFLNETPTSVISIYNNDKNVPEISVHSQEQQQRQQEQFENQKREAPEDPNDDVLKRCKRKPPKTSSNPLPKALDVDVGVIREQVENMLKRWLTSNEEFFEIPYSLANLKIRIEVPETVIGGEMTYGEPAAFIWCNICNSTVRIQSLCSRTGFHQTPVKRWVLSNFQRHVKRAHFKPEFRPRIEYSVIHEGRPLITQLNQLDV